MDPKGRVFIPKRFLSQMASSEPQHFIIARGFEGCLTLYPESSWRQAVDRISQGARGEKQVRDFRRLLFSMASRQQIDGMGRILVPKALREIAKIKRKVVFIGLQDEIELWDLGRWTEYEKGESERFDRAGRSVL